MNIIKDKLNITKKKVILFFLLVSMLPFKACHITFGFPVVSYSNRYNFNFIGAIINVFFIFIFSYLFLKFYKSKFFKDSYHTGISVIIIFNVFYLLYFLLEHITYASSLVPIYDIILIILFPFYILLPYTFLDPLSALAVPPLFPNDTDMLPRIYYLLSVFLYFFVGVLIHKLYNLYKLKYKSSK